LEKWVANTISISHPFLLLKTGDGGATDFGKWELMQCVKFHKIFKKQCKERNINWTLSYPRQIKQYNF
jgi:hypothetical protein